MIAIKSQISYWKQTNIQRSLLLLRSSRYIQCGFLSRYAMKFDFPRENHLSMFG